VLTARNEARGLEAVEGVRRSGGGSQDDVVFHQLDVTDPDSVGRLADFVRDQFGKLDILVYIYPCSTICLNLGAGRFGRGEVSDRLGKRCILFRLLCVYFSLMKLGE
jgi:hypothetical protein